MARWRRWTFPLQAPMDDFLHLLHHGLVVRNVQVDDAKHFDLVARAFGTRAYLSLAWNDAGVELTAKLKAGIFGSPTALERVVLEAAEEAAARLAKPPAPPPGGTGVAARPEADRGARGGGRSSA